MLYSGLDIFFAAIIGGVIGSFGAFMIEFVYRFKGTPKASLVRVFSGVAVAIIATTGDFLVKHYLYKDGQEDLYVTVTFAIFGLCSFVVGMYLRRHKIG